MVTSQKCYVSARRDCIDLIRWIESWVHIFEYDLVITFTPALQEVARWLQISVERKREMFDLGYTPETINT